MRVRIFNANASSVAGELPIEASLPQLWIENPADESRARDVIAAFFRPAPAGPPTRCPKCGEENPPSFDLCWACGTGLERARTA